MNTRQALLKIPEKKPLVWVPAERTPAIIIPVGGVSANQLLFMEQSAALQAGRCPLCHGGLTHSVDKDQMVTFKCVKQPVFHEWRRDLSFLSRD